MMSANEGKGGGVSQPISDFSDKGGSGGRAISDYFWSWGEGGGGIRHILTFLTISEWKFRISQIFTVFSEYDKFWFYL